MRETRIFYFEIRLKGILDGMSGESSSKRPSLKSKDAGATSPMKSPGHPKAKKTITSQGAASATRLHPGGPPLPPMSPRPHRKRSNSLPNSKIILSPAKSTPEVANAGTPSSHLQSTDDKVLPRAVSLGTRMRQRKKSIGNIGDQVKGFRQFKNFVESKILSKSSQDIDQEGAASGATSPAGAQPPPALPGGGSGSSASGEGPPSARAAAGAGDTKTLSARDYFTRRSSRTSFSEFDPLAPTATTQKSSSAGQQQLGLRSAASDATSSVALAGGEPFQSATTAAAASKAKSATVEDPDTELPDSSQLSKGKSMPSLR